MATVSGIITCNNNACEFCRRGSLDTNVNFYGNCTDVEYNVDFRATCTTKCCIYLLSCKTCNIKYVGKTWNSIRERFNGHRGRIRRNTEAYAMYNHFCGPDGHGITNMMIKPIELCKKEDLINREKFWIAELNSLFPYGLNMEANFNGISDAYQLVTRNISNKSIYSVFNKRNSNRTKKGGRKRTGSNNNENANSETFIAKDYVNNLIEYAGASNNFVHALRSRLLKLDILSMKKVFLEAIRLISQGTLGVKQVHEYSTYIIKDICLFKLSSLFKDKSTNKNGNFIVIKFCNKLVENVNLRKILCHSNIKSLFPVKDKNVAIPSIAYERSNSIRSKVLNYRQTLIDDNYANFTCKCDNYGESFKDEHHHHIITGNMNIVDNIQLRKLLEKGLNFHEQQPPNKEVALKAFRSGIDSYISTISNKLRLSCTAFTPWKTELIKRVEIQLEKCKSYDFNKILCKPVVKEALRRLHNDFVLAPVDKAGNNMAIICKKYYMEIVSKEIEDSETFSVVNNTQQGIIQSLKASGFVNSDDTEKLPMLYATIKMHKVPVGFRYITAGIDTVLQNLSIAVGKCLKKLLQVACNAKSYKIKEIDYCTFIINSRDKVVNFMETSAGSRRKRISTWDFSTLYTKIPHNRLVNSVTHFINDTFKCVNDKKFIACPIGNYGAYFTKAISKTNRCFTKEQLINAVKCIINNAYITFHGQIYRQVIGVPMGTNCAPYLANIFLHHYEYEYLKLLVEQGDIQTAKDLANTFRYQDDCITLNDNGRFAIHHDKIYPREMVLNDTNISRDKSTFLDLKISIYRGKFLYGSYDKRDDFKFHVVNFPNLKGNIPGKQSYGVYISQLVRFCDINITYKGFLKDINKMNDTLIDQGYKRNLLKKKYDEFCCRYIHKWAKYYKDISGLSGL